MTTLNILLAGNPGSGKTTVTNSLLPAIHHSKSKNYAFHMLEDSNIFVYNHIPQFQLNCKESLVGYFQKAHELLFCVNVAEAKSFQQAEQWLQEYAATVPSAVTITLIATHWDQEEPKVTDEQLRQSVSNHNLAAYFRVNARDPEHQGVVQLKSYLSQRLNDLVAKEAFPEKLPYYKAFLKEQLLLLTPVISHKRDQLLSSWSILGFGKKRTDANREFNALNNLKKEMEELLNQSPEIVYELESALRKIIDKIKAEDQGAFDKHGSFAFVRPLPKVQRFCNDLLDGARGAVSSNISRNNNNH